MTIKEITMEQANQIMYDAIKRWQRARKAMSDFNFHFHFDNRDADFEKHQTLWDELSNAEQDLMDI